MTSVSVLFGTHNRRAYLEPCVQSVREDLAHSALVSRYEIVVADGASTDGSREWFLEQPDCRLVEGGLEGAVPAFNAAFAAADPTANFICLLNDDCLVSGPAITESIRLLEANPTAGQCAIPFRRGEAPYRTDRYTVVPGPYANFGVLRGALARGIAQITTALWAPCYRTYGADCELSYWVYKLGWRVLVAPGGVEDLGARDALRTENTKNRRWHRDAFIFQQRWPYQLLRLVDEKPWLQHTTIDKETLHRFQELRASLGPPAL